MDNLKKNDHSLCKARFHQLSLNLANGLGSNCSHLPEKELTLDSDLINLNTDDVASLKAMIDGVRPKECAYVCWNLEDKKLYSPRQKQDLSHPILKNKKNENYTPENFQTIRTAEWVNLKITNVCNFKCLYCSDKYSTAWKKEYLTNGFFKTVENLHFSSIDESTLFPEKSFIESVLRNIKSLSQLDISGGEPLLSESLFLILDKLRTTKLDKMLTVVIATNLSSDENLWSRFKSYLIDLEKNENLNILIMASIDAWGVRSEYIRNGLNFSQFYSRIIWLLSNTRVQLGFSITSTLLSLSTFPRLMLWIADLKVQFQNRGRFINIRLDQVRNFTYLKNDLLHIKNIDAFDNQILKMRPVLAKVFTPLEMNIVNNMCELYRNSATFDFERASKLKSFLKQIDQRFNVDSAKIFPEIELKEDHCVLDFENIDLKKACE
jgi:hypothetical protein